jgi:hypothetical protein
VIGPEDRARKIESGEDVPQLPHRLLLRERREAALGDAARQRGVVYGHQAQAGQKGRLHGVEGHGGLVRMGGGQLLAADADEDHDRYAEAGVLGADAAVDHVAHRPALAHAA